MAEHIRDRIVGLLLLAFAIGWIVVVIQTIPVIGGEGEYGPRFFPLVLGIILAVLSVFMVAGTMRKRLDADGGEAVERLDSTEVVGVAATVVLIVGYGFVMQQVGFLAATPVLIAGVLYLLLRVRSVVFIAVFALGLTFAVHVIFAWLLGAYLPPGNWHSWF